MTSQDEPRIVAWYVKPNTLQHLTTTLQEMFPGADVWLGAGDSADQPEAWIHIILPYAAWLTFLSWTVKQFTSEFFKTLGSRAANGLIDAAKGLAKRTPHSTEVERLANELRAAEALEGRRMALVVALPMSFATDGCYLPLEIGSPESLADQIILFGALLDGIKAAIDSLESDGVLIGDRCLIGLTNEGINLTYFDAKTLAPRVESFDFEGNRLDKPAK